MSNVSSFGKIRMNAEIEKDNLGHMVESEYPFKIPEVYLWGSGEVYNREDCFAWENDSVVIVRDRHVIRYAQESHAEVFVENENGDRVWKDSRVICDEQNVQEVEDLRGGYHYIVEEYDMDTLKKRKYKVVLEEEDFWSDSEYDILSQFVSRESLGCRFIITDGTLIKYLGYEDDIVVPEGIIDIAAGAFSRDKPFNSITLPKTLVDISSKMFCGCSVRKIEVAADNPRYYSKDGCIVNRETQTLVWCYAGKTIPSDGSVRKIGYKAFCRRWDIITLEVPETVCEIEDAAFYDCWLQELTIPDRLVDDIKRIYNARLEKIDGRWVLPDTPFPSFSFLGDLGL